jgi:translation initiation factor 5B
VDRLYGWKKLPDGPIRDALALQDENCLAEFKDRADNAILQLNKLGLNAKMYWENDSIEDTVRLQTQLMSNMIQALTVCCG